MIKLVDIPIDPAVAYNTISSTFSGSVLFHFAVVNQKTCSVKYTTTSTQDSGLLNVLVPLFEKESGFQVKTISVGSGQAMKMGEKGEADVLLVHSPDAEKKFMAEGFGDSRRLVMHNDFIIVGPPADPAKIKSVTAADAMKRIARSGAIFVSRGDTYGAPLFFPDAGKNPASMGL